jgi:Acyl-CoA dehydrogenase, N-terminal domain
MELLIDPSVSAMVDVNNTLVINAFLNYGSEELKRKYLPRLCQDTVGSYALSEAGAGLGSIFTSGLSGLWPETRNFQNGSTLFVFALPEAAIERKARMTKR